MKKGTVMGIKNVTEAAIMEGLSRLPLPKNPILMTHSSLKSFGYVEGGAAAVIQALLTICGVGGTLVMPTLSFKSIDESAPFWDARETCSDTGLITEVFRNMPGARRSMHIVSSAAALGQDSLFLTQYHDDTPCGPGSPYWKLIERGGYSLFIGVGFGSNTLFHAAEETVNPAYLRYKTISNARMRDMEGSEFIRDYRRYDCYQAGVIRHLDRMGPVFRDRGVLFETDIGDSHLILLSAEQNFKISCEVLKTKPEYIL